MIKKYDQEVRLKMEQKTEKIINWIKEKVNEARAKGIVIGLSGGIDSSIVAVLCKKAFPNNIQGVIIPCGSNPLDRKHAEMVAEKYSIPYEVVDLQDVFKTKVRLLEKEEYNPEKHRGLAIANIKPRLRMTTLYYFANKFNYLVAGTDNKSEEKIGYFTKYGDGGVDILPIVDLYKREVRELAKHLGIPEEIINKKPSAGLWEGQTDEEEMEISYEELDEILDGLDKNKILSGVEPEKIEKVRKMVACSEHKRKMPPGCILN